MNKNEYSKNEVESSKILRSIVLLYIFLFIFVLINSLFPHYEFKGLYILKYYAQYGFLTLAIFCYILSLIASIKLNIKENKILLVNIIFIPIYIIYSIIYNYFYHLYNNNYVNFLVFLEGIVFIIIQIIITRKLKKKYGKEITKIKDNYYKEDYLIGVNKNIDIPSSKFKLVNGFLLVFNAFEILPSLSIVSLIYYLKINSNLYKGSIIFIVLTFVIEITLLIIFLKLNQKYKIYNYKYFLIILVKLLFIYLTFIISALIFSNTIKYNDDSMIIGTLVFFSFLCYFTFSIFLKIIYPFYTYFIEEKYKELKDKETLNKE